MGDGDINVHLVFEVRHFEIGFRNSLCELVFFCGAKEGWLGWLVGNVQESLKSVMAELAEETERVAGCR